MKRNKIVSLFLALALSASCFAATVSGLTVDGNFVNAASMITFLNNPVLPNLGVTGAITPTGGLAAGGVPPLAITNLGPNVPVALASLGTSSTDQNAMFLTDIFVPANMTITKVSVLQGSTAGTDKVYVAIYDPAGKLIANSDSAGLALNSSANTFLDVSLLATTTLVGPATYYVGVQGNGTASNAIRLTATPYIYNRTAVVVNTAPAVPASITLPTAWTTVQAPIVVLK